MSSEITKEEVENRNLLNLAIWQCAHELALQSPTQGRKIGSYEAVESTEREIITGLGKVLIEVEPVDEDALENAVIYTQRVESGKSREVRDVMTVAFGETQMVNSLEAGVFRYYHLWENGMIEKIVDIDDGVKEISSSRVNDISVEERTSLLSELEAINSII